MHEYSIVQALMAQVAAEADAHHAERVERIHVSIGELSGVEPDLLKIAFDTFVERSVCEGAELCIRMVPALWSCTRCGRALRAGAILRCEDCQTPATLSQGDEIILDRLEMEVAHV